MKIEITLKDPAKELPPLNTDILAVVESSIDRGHGFKVHHEFRVLRILPEDCDGDEDERGDLRRVSRRHDAVGIRPIAP